MDDGLADVLAEHLRSGLERAQEQRLDEVVVEARVSRVELRISDGAQDIEPLIQGRNIRMDVDEQRCALFYYTVRAPRSLNRILGGRFKWKASNLPSVV